MNTKLGNNEYDFILTIDQGGHASRATLYPPVGEVKFGSSCSIDTQHIFVDGIEYIQHDVNDIIQSIQTVLLKCAEYLGDTQQYKVKAGFATQRSTIVCWNYKTGEVLSSAISWQDTRAIDYCTKLKSNSELIKTKTGLFLSPHYGFSKIRWCLDNINVVQEAYKNKELCIAPLSSYLLYSSVDGEKRIVDPANAARTLLLNKETLDWDEDLLELFSIPKSILPDCVTSKYHYGQLLNWEGQCDVHLCTGDQSAAVFSQGIPPVSDIIVNIGSGAFVLNINGKKEPPARILSGNIYTDDESKIKAWEGTVNGAGTALDWLQQKNPAINIYQNLPNWLKETKNRIPLFINGISGVGSPYWIASLKSRFIHEKSMSLSDKAIAVLESIIFLITENINLMKTSSEHIIKISGGLSVLDGVCQKLSDLSGFEVSRTDDKEATQLGLFYLLTNTTSSFNTDKYKIFKPALNKLLLNRYLNWKTEMAKE